MLLSLLTCILPAVVSPVPPAGAAAVLDVPAAGFGLYRYKPPGWAWTQIVDPANPVASVIPSERPGECTLRFVAPVGSLAGFRPDAARVGLVSGYLGTEPAVWLPVGGSYRTESAPSPLDSGLFGEAMLRSATASVDGNVLRIDVTLDAPPVMQTGWDLYVYIDADGDRATGFMGGDFLLQNASLGPGSAAGLQVAWLEVEPGILEPGREAVVTGVLHNATAAPLQDVRAELVPPPGVRVSSSASDAVGKLLPGECRWLTWRVRASEPGAYRMRFRAAGGGQAASRSQWLSVVPRRDRRREFETASGAWVPFPSRPTLQQGNARPVSPYRSLPSARLRRNLFGITAHLPRSTNLEDPFEAAHAADGDPETCWASRWWRTAVPFAPEWIEADLGAVTSLDEVRFLPAWRNGGVPAAFTVDVSANRGRWATVARETSFALSEQPPGPLRVGDRSWQRFRFEACRARYVRITATRLNQGATSFFCAPYEPFQFRVAELAGVGADGAVVRPRAVRVSSTHAAWYNTPDTIRRTWPLELRSGVKLNRISQWGDKTDWASVETTRGVYHIDPEVDRAVDESVRGGVDILLTLDYGNNLYGQLKSAPDWGPTWHRSHPFLQCAPTTPEALEAWAKWCGFMARHFRGRVKYFEVWNEENGWFFDDWTRNGSIAMARAYGRALLAAAKAVKEANPEAVVVFGGTAGMTLDYPRIALEEGAGPYVDVFAFHPYGHSTPEAAAPQFLTAVGDQFEWKPAPAGIADYEGEIAALRALLHRYNPKMAVWADEMNWFAPGEPAMTSQGDQSELSQAKHLARFYALNGWLGCGAVWWSLYNANHIQEWAVVRTADMTPRPAYYSAGYTATVLDDADGAPDVGARAIGAAPADLMVKTYRNGRGDRIVGLWRTAPASDTCKPAPVTVRIPGLGGAAAATLVDVLYGYRQPAGVERDGADLLVPGVLVGDWPVFVVVRPGR